MRHLHSIILCIFGAVVSSGCSTDLQNPRGQRAPSSAGSISQLKVVEIASYQGETYFNFVTSENGLQKSYLEPEYKQSFSLVSKSALSQASDNFDPQVYRQVLSQFAQQQMGLDQLADELGVQRDFNPATLPEVVGKILESKGLSADPQKVGNEAVNIVPYIGLASGSGISVVINRDNYFYNYGVQKSYGASPGHKALDTSDLFYLDEIESLITTGTSPVDVRSFYRSLFSTLVQCNTSGYFRLSVPAQTVLTDFITAHTAGLVRTKSSKGKHARAEENDLLELTMLASYSATTGLIPSGRALVKGRQNQLSSSPIASARYVRRNYQLAVGRAMEQLHPELTAKIKKVIGENADGDLIHATTLFLNNPENQSLVKLNANALIENLSEYLSLMHDDADLLTKAGVQSSFSKISGKSFLK